MALSLPQTDVIFLDSLSVSADIGPDCWSRARSQPLTLSVYLLLHQQRLDLPGMSDSVTDSIHYGHLTKSIQQIFKNSPSFEGLPDIINSIFRSASEFASTAGALSSVAGIRITLSLPKQILLAEDFTVEVEVPILADPFISPKRITVHNMTIPVIIGVNPPERLSKQRVITTITFIEIGGHHQSPDYPTIVNELASKIEASSYLTLEKLVLEIVRTACLSSEFLDTVTVSCRKPSALSFAQASGVEITRSRSSLVSTSSQ